MVDTDWAGDARRWRSARRSTFTTPTGKQATYKIAGTFKNQAGLTAPVIVTNAELETVLGRAEHRVRDGRGRAGHRRGRAGDGRPTRRWRAFPAAEALTREQFKDNRSGQINQLLGLVYGLLLLSVIVALLGIVNTLALSVHERTRELGMLRAVGMSRRQVRRMVRAESVITAGIGAILGIVLGIVFALVVSRPLADAGLRVHAADRDADPVLRAGGGRGRGRGDPARARVERTCCEGRRR